MTPELQRYYEARMSMMADVAWKDLMDDVEAMKKATDTVSGISDLQALGVRQGELRIMDWLLSLKEISEQTYQQLQEDQGAEP